MPARHYPRTLTVGDTTGAFGEERLRVIKGKTRNYAFLQNLSANDIYVNFGTHADINNGFTLGAGLFYERDRSVPQEDIYVRGSVPGSQKVMWVEGYEQSDAMAG